MHHSMTPLWDKPSCILIVIMKKMAMHFDLHWYGVLNEYMSGKEVHQCDLNPPEELCWFADQLTSLGKKKIC
jgi:hypothetical protein